MRTSLDPASKVTDDQTIFFLFSFRRQAGTVYVFPFSLLFSFRTVLLPLNPRSHIKPSDAVGPSCVLRGFIPLGALRLSSPLPPPSKFPPDFQAVPPPFPTGPFFRLGLTRYSFFPQDFFFRPSPLPCTPTPSPPVLFSVSEPAVNPVCHPPQNVIDEIFFLPPAISLSKPPPLVAWMPNSFPTAARSFHPLRNENWSSALSKRSTPSLVPLLSFLLPPFDLARPM